jgi:predicted transcriptional regulator
MGKHFNKETVVKELNDRGFSNALIAVKLGISKPKLRKYINNDPSISPGEKGSLTKGLKALSGWEN